MTTLGERLRQRRDQLHITQEALATEIGKDQKQVWQYETNRTQPSASVLADLAQALQTTTDYLLGLTDVVDRSLRGQGDLNENERQLLELYRRKSPEKQKQVFDIVRVL